ncbi:HD domain-containing protein [Cuniculiplasma sp. SKW3]|uniref:HD domain-containing protein n=1 Tax=Cuniculiplasma sp. SKW3 TaxID=3400170 RepID=UPI003FCF9278
MFKNIQDPIWGAIELDPDLMRIVDTFEFQRLHWIRQLGMCFIVFPGAVHTRFQHSLGTMHVASLIGKKLEMDNLKEISTAALLHDIGHFPFSHSFENYFMRKYKLDHEKEGIRLIKGEEGTGSIGEAMDRAGIDKKMVISILSKSAPENYVNVISGPLDADEMDYLARDSYFSGANLSPFDFQRIINMMKTDGKKIYIEYKGVSSVESIMISRFLMYKTVYFHKTVRIVQKMVERALEMANIGKEGVKMNDFQLMEAIGNEKSGKNIMERVSRRDLDKVLYRRDLKGEPEATDKIMEKIQEEFQDISLDILPPISFRNRDRVKNSIPVLHKHEFVDIMNISPLVESLYASFNRRELLIYGPRGYPEHELKRVIDLLPS